MQLQKLQKRRLGLGGSFLGLGVVPSILDTIELHYDNNGATAQAKEPRSYQRSKRILRRFHLIRGIVDRRGVKICKVPGESDIADPLTKQLARPKFDSHIRSFGLRIMHDWD